VFAGTINGNEYLRDETGGRRWWPWPCSKIDIPGLTTARDQLWAEARARYDQGDHWWLDSKELEGAAAKEQAVRLITDPWTDQIAQYLANYLRGETSRRHWIGVSIDELLSHVGVALQDRQQRDANRVAAVLRSLGWHVRSTRIPDKPYPVKRYYPDQQ
jgi:predicted P-loop ATPase